MKQLLSTRMRTTAGFTTSTGESLAAVPSYVPWNATRTGTPDAVVAIGSVALVDMCDAHGRTSVTRPSRRPPETPT